MILHNLGHALLYKGSLDEARTSEQRAAVAFHSQGALRLEGVTRTYAAKIALASGDLAAAESEARAAKEMLAAEARNARSWWSMAATFGSRSAVCDAA